MPYNYDRYEGGRGRQNARGRSTFGYWVPLVMTVTAASFGLAAWIWSERRDDEDEEYNRKQRGPRQSPPPTYGDVGAGETSFGRDDLVSDDGSGSFITRVSGALQRTPSPQQMFEGARGKVVAGVVAASAAVGGALSSIREEERDDFADHSRWSEEAEVRNTTLPAGSNQPSDTIPDGSRSLSGPGAESSATNRPRFQSVARIRTVVVVVSAEADDAGLQDGDVDYHQESASVLSHLPEYVDNAATRLFVLIYAPELRQHPLATAPKPAGSVTSSFSHIGQEDMHTPAEEFDKPLASMDPNPATSPSSGMNTPHTPGSTPLFNTLYLQAQTLVEDETMIMPFTTPSGHIHLLKHLSPDIVYLQENLCGRHGDAVSKITGWVGQVVIVVGADGGHGGLIDTEDEGGPSTTEQEEKWWQQSERVGLGKGLSVVESLRIGEDWGRRVGGRD